MDKHLAVFPLTFEDLPQVARLEALCLPGPWDQATLRDQLALPQSVLRGIRAPAGPLVAYMCGWWLAGELEILRLACHPEYRRQGFAEALVVALRNEFAPQGLQRLLLEVRAHNRGAIAFYRQLGFVDCGRRRRYYPDGDDALLLELAHMEITR